MKTIALVCVAICLTFSLASSLCYHGSYRTSEESSVVPVAFYVYYSRTFKALQQNQPFIFDVVETNYGNGYDKNTGVFTAPSAGLYAFSWTIHAAGTHQAGSSGQYGEMVAVLKQNGVAKGSIYADTEKEYDDDSGTGFVILAVSTRDTFQIVSQTEGQGAFYSTMSNGKTSFSGFRIA